MSTTHQLPSSLQQFDVSADKLTPAKRMPSWRGGHVFLAMHTPFTPTRAAHHEPDDAAASGAEPSTGEGQVPARSPVVVKLLAPTAATAGFAGEFLHEAEVMARLSHRSILGFIGVSVVSSPWMAVYAHTEAGSLGDHLLARRQAMRPVPVERLCTMAADVASGMAYLHGKRVVHLSLSAQNVRLTAQGGVKIGGFRVAQALHSASVSAADAGTDAVVADTTSTACTNGGRRGGGGVEAEPPYMAYMAAAAESPGTRGGLVPMVGEPRYLLWRWTAPECMGPDPFVGFPSDVWAFGVLCWELFSGGGVPYSTTTTNGAHGQSSQLGPAVISRDNIREALLAGSRLTRPAMCPDLFCDTVMQPCWEGDAERRPTFSQLLRRITKVGPRGDRDTGGSFSAGYTVAVAPGAATTTVVCAEPNTTSTVKFKLAVGCRACDYGDVGNLCGCGSTRVVASGAHRLKTRRRSSLV